MSEKTISKEIRENGVTERITVEKVKGGYIVTKTKYGKPEDDENAEWVDQTERMVTTENPLKEDKDEDDSKHDKMFDFIDKPLIDLG